MCAARSTASASAGGSEVPAPLAGPGVAERVRLTPGRHDSPGEGACVVELASLIAGEEFSDRPICVCPVIGAFLRAWNDRAAYADRQRLRPYAERVIGSLRAPADRMTRATPRHLPRWAGADPSRGWMRSAASRLAMRLRIASFVGIREAFRLEEGAPEYAARLLLGRRDLTGAFLLLDAMLAIGHAAGDGGSIAERPVPASANGHAPAPANGNGHGHIPTPVSGNGHPAAPANGNGATPAAPPERGSRSRTPARR